MAGLAPGSKEWLFAIRCYATAEQDNEKLQLCDELQKHGIQ